MYKLLSGLSDTFLLGNGVYATFTNYSTSDVFIECKTRKSRSKKKTVTKALVKKQRKSVAK